MSVFSWRFAFRTPFVFLVLAVVVGGLVSPASAQKQRFYDVSEIRYDAYSGVQVNGGQQDRVGFEHSIRIADAAWIRVELSGVFLDRGDYIRIHVPDGAVEQRIDADDPQLWDPVFEGMVHSMIFEGGDVDVELHVTPGSRGAGMTIDKVVVAQAPREPIKSQCGPNDDRVAANDPCILRIVDSKGGWGTGFMISDNWLVTANHVMTDGPWTIQRNVPPSDSTTGGIKPPTNANDSFPLANLTNATLSPGATFGDDWAVINLPNNAGGAPGAGCARTYNCSHDTSKVNVQLTVTGFGTDTETKKNGTLQTHTGSSAKGGANDCNFRYKVDTYPNNSGSPVTDSSGRIVGIHTNGGCQADSAETGANSGTLITNPGLVAAIKRRCGINICPQNNPQVACIQAGGDAGCCEFTFTVTNPGPKAINTFYIDFELGNGGPCNDLSPTADITPPPGYTATFCYGWDYAAPSNWGVTCFQGGTIPPGGTVMGRMNVRVNDNTPKNVNIPGWDPFTVPPYGLLCAATSFNPASVAKNCGLGQFGPHIQGQQDCWSPVGEWICEQPVATILRSYDAVPREGRVELSWALWDIDAGVSFIVSRAGDDGVFREVSGALTASSDRLAYTFEDRDYVPGESYRYRVVVDRQGEREFLFQTAAVRTHALVTALHRSFPNPFNPSTVIGYTIAQREHVVLRVYNATGQLVRTLVDAVQPPSKEGYQVTWNGTDDTGNPVASGVYFYRLTAGRFEKAHKMVLIK